MSGGESSKILGFAFSQLFSYVEGRLTDLSDVHPLNADDANLVTPSGTTAWPFASIA